MLISRIISTGLPAIVLWTVVLCSPTGGAQAAEFTSSLSRCTMDGKATLCFDAFSTATDVTETCAMLSLRTRLVYVRGGGKYFGPTSFADETRYRPEPCNSNNTVRLQAAYIGYVKPCAPGGTQDWEHRSEHIVVWADIVPDTDVFRVKTYPLRVSTCTGGGPLP